MQTYPTKKKNYNDEDLKSDSGFNDEIESDSGYNDDDETKSDIDNDE